MSSGQPERAQRHSPSLKTLPLRHLLATCFFASVTVASFVVGTNTSTAWVISGLTAVAMIVFARRLADSPAGQALLFPRRLWSQFGQLVAEEELEFLGWIALVLWALWGFALPS